MASLTNLLLYKNMFHVVPHDVFYDAVEEVLYDVLVKTLPILVIRSTCETICESVRKNKFITSHQFAVIDRQQRVEIKYSIAA